MKHVLVGCVLLLAIGCAQQKQAVTKPAEVKHRYATVFEGNKIIRYDKETDKPNKVADENYHLKTQTQPAEIVLPKVEMEPLPRIAAPQKTASQKSKKRFVTIMKDVAIKRTFSAPPPPDGDATGHEGTVGFSLIMASFVLGIVGLIVAVALTESAVLTGAVLFVLSFAAFIAGLVLSIIGVAKNNGKTDYTLGWIGVGIGGFFVLMSIISAIASSL